jgi:hypothetical protein
MAKGLWTTRVSGPQASQEIILFKLSFLNIEDVLQTAGMHFLNHFVHYCSSSPILVGCRIESKHMGGLVDEQILLVIRYLSVNSYDTLRLLATKDCVAENGIYIRRNDGKR